jgi:hypothetical protein
MTTEKKKPLDAYPMLKHFVGAYWFMDFSGDVEGILNRFLDESTPEEIEQLKTDIERVLALNESPETIGKWLDAEYSGRSLLEDPRTRLKAFRDQIVKAQTESAVG